MKKFLVVIEPLVDNALKKASLYNSICHNENALKEPYRIMNSSDSKYNEIIKPKIINKENGNDK